jgi:hypothetical protein
MPSRDTYVYLVGLSRMPHRVLESVTLDLMTYRVNGV